MTRKSTTTALDAARRSRVRRHTSVRAAAVAAGVLIAACGGGSASTSAASNAAAAGASPAESALGLDKKELQRRQLKVEALVATCMKNQGFDYIPLDPTNVVPGQSGQVGLPNLSEDDFRKQYGFGITTLFGVTTPSGTPVSSNPNTKIRNALSAADGAAYDKALSGTNADGSTFASAISQGDFSNLGGCYKQATEKVFGGPQVLSAVQTALDDLDKRVKSDPRVAVAQRLWSDCVNKGGFQFSTSDEIDKFLTTKLETIVGKPAATGTPPATGNAPPTGTLPAVYDKAALASLQQEELKLAELDHSCDLKFTKQANDKVQLEVEQAFVAQNPSLIGKVKG